MSTPVTGCDFCEGDGGALIFRHEKWRVIRVEGGEGDAFAGYTRVIWNAHVRELTDLSAAERQQFMAAVFAVEGALRASLTPHKMNVASLGNLTPHLHWHIIPRYLDDPAFPKPVWALPASAFTADPALATLAHKQARETITHAHEGEGDNWEQAVRRALESL